MEDAFGGDDEGCASFFDGRDIESTIGKQEGGSKSLAGTSHGGVCDGFGFGFGG